MPSVTKAFNPHNQTITILMADGVTEVTVSLQDIDAANWYNAAGSINYGAQLGACVVMFFVLLLLTNARKRRSAIFILNLFSLILGTLRALLLALFFVSPWVNTYPTWTTDYSEITSAEYATSVAAVVIPFLMTVTILISLVLQAHTVSKNIDDMYRHTITGLGCGFLLVSVGFRFAQMITNSMAILSHATYYSKKWITMGTLISSTASIWYFSLIFTGKLLFTLYIRQRNGWKQWSGVRILAAMGGCTMLIPSIFAILEYVTVYSFPEAGTLSMTMVALLLPLSALWAGMAIDSETSILNLSHLAGSVESSRRGSADATYNSRNTCGSQLSQSSGPSRIEYFNEKNSRKGSLSPISPTTIDSRVEFSSEPAPRDSTEVDLEAMGVRVDRSYSIHSGRK